MSTGWFLTLCSLSLTVAPFQVSPPIPSMNNITCQINLSYWWPGLYELTALYSRAYLQACYYFRYWLLYKKHEQAMHERLSSCGKHLPPGCYMGKWFMTKRCRVLFLFFSVAVCVTVEERGREREAMRSLPTQVFCCFSFHLSGISLCSCGTRWSLLLIHSLSFSVAHSQEKSHLCPIKTSLSPSKLIACVSVCVQVISRGWTEFRFAARQKENKY